MLKQNMLNDCHGSLSLYSKSMHMGDFHILKHSAFAAYAKITYYHVFSQNMKSIDFLSRDKDELFLI